MSPERTQRGGDVSVQLMIQNENVPERNPATTESRLNVSSDQTIISTSQIAMKTQQVALLRYDSDSELSFEIPSDSYYSDTDYEEKGQDDFVHDIEYTKPYFNVPNLQNQLRKGVDLEKDIFDDNTSNGTKHSNQEIPLTDIKPPFILSEAHNKYVIKACMKPGGKDIVNEDESIKAINASQGEEEIISPLSTVNCVADISASCVQEPKNSTEEKNHVRNETNADNIHRLPLIALNGVNFMHETPGETIFSTNIKLENDESEDVENSKFTISTTDSHETVNNVGRLHGQTKKEEHNDRSVSSDCESLEDNRQDRIYGTCPKLNIHTRRKHLDSGIGSSDSASPEVIGDSQQYFKEQKEEDTCGNYSSREVNNNDMLGDVSECSCPLLLH